MNDQVMMDAKFTLFAILLAVAIASPSEPGTNSNVPDYLVVYGEWNVPTSNTSPSPVPWIIFPEAKHLLEKGGVVKVYHEVEDPDRGVMVAMATVWPAPPGTWTMTFAFPMQAQISTRNGTKNLNIQHPQQMEAIVTK